MASSTATTPGVALRLATLIAATRDDALPAQSIYWSKIGLLDTLGVTLAGAIEDCARIATEATLADDAAGPSVIIGTRRRVSALDAALINGTAAHALDYDDCSDTLGGHPSAPILPALFALAVVSGALAARRGDISASIFLHIGFNLITVLLALTGS